mgnify:CR=1 FL=1
MVWTQKEDARESYEFIKGDEGRFGVPTGRPRDQGETGDGEEQGGDEGGPNSRASANLAVCLWQNVDIGYNLRYKECAWLRFRFRGQADGLTVHVPQSIMKRSVALRFSFFR